MNITKILLPKRYKRRLLSYHEKNMRLAGVGRAGNLDDVARAERRTVERRREDDWGPRGEGAGDEGRRRLVYGQPRSGISYRLSGHG